MDKIVGNDISYAQGFVNFDVYKNNSNFAIFKDTEGVGFQDPQFQRNHAEAHRVGLLVGWYHFARPDLGNTAEAEADGFLGSIGELHEGEFLVLDFEVPGTVQWCLDFLNHIYAHTKIQPLIYLNKSEVRNYDWTPVAKAGYGLWLAAYDNNLITGAWPFVAMQQWTNAQQVPGITGKVDGDYFFGTADQLRAYGYHVPVPVTSPSASVSPSSSVSDSYSPSASSSPSVSPSSSESHSVSPSASASPSLPVPPQLTFLQRLFRAIKAFLDSWKI